MDVQDTSIDEIAEQYPKAYRDKDILVMFYYLGELSMRQIGEAFDVTTQTVQSHMEKHGLPRREGGGSA